MRRAIAAAIDAGPGAEVCFGAGRYHLGADEGGRAALLIRNADDLTIRGAGAATELIVTDPRVGSVSASRTAQSCA